jgi:hypothetical protein
LFIRYWAAIVTALATAALVDWSSEILADAGWLGGLAASDGHQEAVFPVVVLAALAAVALGLTVALRAGRGDQIRYRGSSASHRVAMAVAGLVAVFIVITLMEAYEMQFGELSALDPRSVFVEHWPAVFIGYVVVSALVSRIVGLILGVAAAAGQFAAHVIVAFLHVDLRPRAAMPRAVDSFGTRVQHRPQAVEFGALGLRAPPPLQLLQPEQLFT